MSKRYKYVFTLGLALPDNAAATDTIVVEIFDGDVDPPPTILNFKLAGDVFE